MKHTLLLLALVGFMPVTASETPPHVLMIAVDDLKTLGSVYSEEPGNFLQQVYPDEALRREVATRMTPNLQRLADRGVTFTNAYCAAPGCNPSRAAMMTGVPPHVSGLTTNAGGVFFRDYEYEGKKPLADAITIAQLLKANGWYTASSGKIFHTKQDFEASDGPLSWTDWTHVRGTAGPMKRSPYSEGGLDWGVEGDPDATHELTNDYRIGDFFGRLLENGTADSGKHVWNLPSDRPFFLACGFFRPHLPYYATQDLIDLFPIDEMTLTREFLNDQLEDGVDLPPEGLKQIDVQIGEDGAPRLATGRFATILNHGRRLDPNDGDLRAWKDLLQHYFASCAVADRAIGRVLDGLERSAHAANTLVILWSDHNYHLGEKAYVSKFTFWDDGARVNFLIADPRHPKSHGQRSPATVSLLDLYPTLANLAGVNLPDPRIRGQDLAPLLESPNSPWDHPVVSTYRNVDTHLVKSGDYKLIRYEGDNSQVELYDMATDPEEYHNLANEPEHAALRAQMIETLEVALQ